MWKRISLGLMLAFALSSSIAVGQTPVNDRAAGTTQVVPIADLITPIADITFESKETKSNKDSKPEQEHVENLCKLIYTSIAPKSWNLNGGKGSLSYFGTNKVLVINNDPKIVADVLELLTALRKLQDTNIVVDIREIASATFTSDELLKRVDAKLSENDHSAVLNADQVKRLLESVTTDPQVNMVQYPKVTMFNAQTASMKNGEQLSFVTSMETIKKGDQTYMVPKSEIVTTGMSLDLRPVIMEDGKTTRLTIRYTNTSVDPIVPLFPITRNVTPKYEGGAEGTPVPFTQFIQQPKIETHSILKTLAIADGTTVLLPLGKRTRRVTTESAPSVLARVPYVNRLFRNTGVTTVQQDVTLLITARILKNQDDAVSQNR